MTININKADIKHVYNIEVLRNRHRKDLYYCDGRGFLKKMSFFQRIQYFLSKFFNTDYYLHVQARVRHAVTGLAGSIDSGDENELFFLFFKKLSSLSENIYDRSKINHKVLAILRKSLYALSDYKKISADQGLCKKRILGISYLPSGNEKMFKDLQLLKNVVLEAHLALNLGIRTKIPPLGNSKTFFIRDINGKNIAIFKAAAGDSFSIQAPNFFFRLKNKIFTKLGIGGALFKHIAGSCHIAETASYEVDKSIGTNVVPPTLIVHLDPKRWKRKQIRLKKGSLQIFVTDAKVAKKFLGIYQSYKPAKTFSEKNKPLLADELFDKLIINDVVCGNLDRHSENWLVEIDKNNPNKANNIILIDGGAAFSPSHPTSYFEWKKQYLWATTSLEWARKRFTGRAKEIIKNTYNKRFELRKKIVELYLEHGDDMHIALARGEKMVERIEMLYYAAVIKDMRKYKLRYYRTKKQMDKLKESMAGN